MAMTRSPAPKEFGRLGVPILKIGEQAREEIGHSAESEINVAVRKAFNHFPAHVGASTCANHVGVSAHFIKTAHDRNVFADRLSGVPIRLADDAGSTFNSPMTTRPSRLCRQACPRVSRNSMSR